MNSNNTHVADTVEAQFSGAFKTAGAYHGLLNIEIAKASPSLDRLFDYADKLRDAVMLMRLLDVILAGQAQADALATPTGGLKS